MYSDRAVADIDVCGSYRCDAKEGIFKAPDMVSSSACFDVYPDRRKSSDVNGSSCMCHPVSCVALLPSSIPL